MIEEILPRQAATAVVYGKGPDPAHTLLPEETQFVAKAVPGRQEEFGTVRACARRALAGLGVPPVPILRSPRGAPQWPAGLVGSMTHCDGYRAAAVARSEDVSSLGIDAEPNGPLPDGVLEVISLPGERTWIRELEARQPEISWGRLLFSAKESVFKTWYPLTGQELDFTEAELEVCPSTRTFSARLLIPLAAPHSGLRTFTGRWTANSRLVVTAIARPGTE